ncbi:MAG: ferrochelatase [Coriobacteriales bacterium]|jgi:ferrochelatase|nr:ferrochelatase [Coriobacteriales bacterium]
MMAFSRHDKTGIMLVNTGTPDAPTKDAVVPYLRRFLMDRRIVDIPPFFWKPILNWFVLRVRPAKTVAIYKRIWTEAGSPYTLYSEALERALAERAFVSEASLAPDAPYASTCASEVEVPLLQGCHLRMAQRYGNPSIESAIRDFKHRGIEKLVVLPLYPQEALATTASVHDELLIQLGKQDFHPMLHFIQNYYDNDAYSAAVAESIRPHLEQKDPADTHLVFSFHSIPLKDRRRGDPYPEQVKASTTAIAAGLGLADDAWSFAYQSRYDDAQRWLGPFLDRHVEELLLAGTRNLVIACPGFAVDCTETLYDIDYNFRTEIRAFAKASGIAPETLSISCVPCLNDSQAHVAVLEQVLISKTSLLGS